MIIDVKAATHVGMVRELNEDSFVENPEAGTWAVADGMGGHEAGEVASGAVVESLSQLGPASSFEECVENLQRSITEVNRKLVEQSVNYPRERVPGTTVAALAIRGRQGAVVWAGDSRVYRKRDGALEQLTRDHSHVQDLVDRQLIRADEAESHPMANVITRAVGIEDPVQLDTRLFEVREGDQFVLCSDGLSRLVGSPEMAEMLENPDRDEVVQSLLHTALVRGAPDNVTLIYVHCRGDEAADAAATEEGDSEATVVMDRAFVAASAAPAGPAEPGANAGPASGQGTGDGTGARDGSQDERSELEDMGFDTADFAEEVFKTPDDDFEDLDWDEDEKPA